MIAVLVEELFIRDLLSSFVVSSPCDRTVFVEQVSSQPFTAERGAPMAIAASSGRVSLSVLNCIEKRSNAYAISNQCDERPKMHGSRASHMLQLGCGPIVTKNA